MTLPRATLMFSTYRQSWDAPLIAEMHNVNGSASSVAHSITTIGIGGS